ncbi:Hnrnpf [Symbiodinium sp. CCMP2456]|nr:Hnrnpf [Symbiodinium sp. CCMP2456]
MAFQDFPGAGYLRLRGLPFSAGTREVSEFLAEFGIMEENIALGMNTQGRPSGEAWVQFLDVPSAEEAKRQKDRQRIGGRYIEIFGSTFEAANAATRNTTSGGGNMTIPDFPGSSYLRLRGLPYSATQADVAEFFQDYGVSTAQVIMGQEGATGRASGEAWVQFASEEIAAQARAGKDRQMIGTRYIEVFPSTAHEAAKASSRPTQERGVRGAPSAMPAQQMQVNQALAGALGFPAGLPAGTPEIDWNLYAATLSWYAAAAQNAACLGCKSWDRTAACSILIRAPNASV